MDLNASEIIELIERDGDQGERRALMLRLEREARTNSLVEALTSANEANTRRVLLDVLAVIRDPSSLDSILSMLDDQDAGVRAAATDAIGKIFGYVQDPPDNRRREVFVRLTRLWRHETSDDVRSTLAQTLALLGDPGAIPLLREALDNSDRRVRGQAKWGLDYLNRLRDETPLNGE